MADLKNNSSTLGDEPSLPAKRSTEDLVVKDCLDQENACKKKQKSEISAGKTPFQDDDDECKNKENESSDEDDDDEEDGVVDEEEVDEVPSNGKSLVDKKGKGIMTEDKKGKGKLKVEDESNDDDDDDVDSVDGVEHSDDDSDLSNDPLAEVDLDNILPSRTRRRVNQPGAYLVNDIDEDDDSDDSDASV